jgi:uncharacterized membrane protein YqiK
MSATSEAQATRERAQAQAEATRLNGDAQALATRAIGAATAEAYQQGVQALGGEGFTAVQLARILGEHQVKLVPDIAVGGEGAGGLATVLVGKMLQNVGPKVLKSA